MKSLSVIAAILGFAALLGGCGQNSSYRYKLTLTVDTPQGVKSAYNVVEIALTGVVGGGLTTRATGEALYLDLGPGTRPLIALLTEKPFSDGTTRRLLGWDGLSPAIVLARVYGEPSPVKDFSPEYRERLAKHRGAKDISTTDLPHLVTFANVKDPTSVMEVDPSNLAAVLGPGVKWRTLTLEITDEPVTVG